MAPWLFRLKGFSKASSGGTVLSGPDNAPPNFSKDGSVRRTSSKRKQVSSPSDPPRRAQTYSFSTDPHGPFDSGRERQSQITMPHAHAQPPAWDPVPTLHHKRSNSFFLRRRSSDRRKDDHGREAEIRAMISDVPSRPATYTWGPSVPPKQLHKKARTMGAEPGWKHPISEVSLPLRSSIRSSLSSEPELVSYKVSALDALAPRPTLRYMDSRSLPSRGSIPARKASLKRHLADREPIPEETIEACKRIDDLADDFDASELRQLLERDARRRERHQQHERAKMERRLAHKAERQRLQEAEARKSGSLPPENLERGVLGRELAGLVVDPPSAIVTSSKPRTSWERMSGVEEDMPEEPRRSPTESFHPADETLVERAIPPSAEERWQPKVEKLTATEQTADQPSSPRLNGCSASKKSVSKSTLGSDREKASSAYGEELLTRKDSVASSKTGHLSLIALLKWGIKGRRNSSGPSSFSNTSREEMQATATQSRTQGDADSTRSTPAGNYMSKSGLGTPKRLRSRFREDLPELPPKTTAQSLDAQPLTMTEDRQSDAEWASQDDAQGLPTTAHRSIEAPPAPMAIMTEKRTTSQNFEPQMSVSLASVDSEGSWLSGRIGSQRSTTREAAAAKRRNQEQQPFAEVLSNNSYEDDPAAEDEGEARESNARWVAFGGSQPQLVHIHRPDRDTIYSREVLLDIDSGDEEEEDADSPVSQVSEDKVDLHHARSVDINHFRNYSAGSAKLFEIRFSRGSVDDGRRAEGHWGSESDGTPPDQYHVTKDAD